MVLPCIRVSLVARIFLLIGLTLLLVAGGEVFNGLKLRQHRLDEARADAVELARIADLDMARILQGTRQLLATLAKLPADHGWDARACAVLTTTANSDFEYDHLVALDRGGITQCSSSGPSRVGAPVPDPELFGRIVATAGFTVGTYGIGQVSGNELIRVGYPVVDDAGAVVGAVYAGLNLTWLNTAIDQWKLGETVSVDIVDRNGILIARYPNSHGIGHPISDNLKPFLVEAKPGTAEVTEANGVARLYGYTPINAEASAGLAVFVGHDRTPIFANINRLIWLNATVVLAALLLAGIVAVIYVRRFLARPLNRLLTVAERWRGGDWSARTGAASGIPEFDDLSSAFDRMAAEVSAREADISEMARSDALTGLPNRRAFVDALEQALARARRGEQGFAVLYLDLDHFKDINDTLGHPVGDLLLQAVAERLRASVREIDTVARFGGDEFAVIEAEIHEPADAAVLADKLLQTISQPFSLQGNEVRTGTSVGITLYGPEASDAETLLSNADIALYRAKSEGRGTYRFFTDAMDGEVRRRVALETELRVAIETGQLFLLYQPQIDIETGRITGLEAVIHWNHPKHGEIAADAFVPTAERSGLIVALGHWMMREACRQNRAWLDAGIDPCVVAMNISRLQFKTPLELERDIATILMETGLAPDRIELEVTESVLTEASREHNDVLVRLRQSGLRLAIDDFGTGYSSLGYLRQFPVDRIKIAQLFVRDLRAVADYAAIVKATIGLALALDLNVIATGVETAEQLELLRAWGCREAQGAYFAPPLPPDAITGLLRRGRVAPWVQPLPAEAAA
jgi:diguanylate cyclase (GGDEF)-like protein